MMEWRPGVCNCIFQVSHDWKMIKPIQTCARHANADDPGLAARKDSSLMSDATAMLQEKYNVPCTFYFNPGLNLVVQDASVIKQIQADCDNQFGVGLVSISTG